MSLANSIASALLQTHTAMPGIVVRYNPTTHKAEIKPAVQTLLRDGKQYIFPNLLEVPVMWPEGGGGILTFPLNKGDGVLMIFSERDLSNWLSGNQVDSVPVVEDGRIHSISDGIAIPGLKPFATSLGGSGSNVEIRMNAGKANEVKLSLNASGDLIIDSPTQVIVNAGSATVNAPSTTINSTTTINGNTSINGTLDVSTSITAGTSVSAPAIAAATTLTVASKEMSGHTHPYTDDGSGLVTGPPS